MWQLALFYYFTSFGECLCSCPLFPCSIDDIRLPAISLSKTTNQRVGKDWNPGLEVGTMCRTAMLDQNGKLRQLIVGLLVSLGFSGHIREERGKSAVAGS